jgi:hypothetical protein
MCMTTSRDHDGLIRPGLQMDFIHGEKADGSKALPMISQLTEASPVEDASVHIEADWDGNPEKMLLCARYRGRRFMALSPALADSKFCQAYVEPVKEPESRPLGSCIPCPFSNLINGQSIRVPDDENVPVLVQVYGKPVLRYISVVLFSKFFSARLSSNCIHAAIVSHRKGERQLAVIGSQGYGCPLVSPECSNSHSIIYAVG